MDKILTDETVIIVDEIGDAGEDTPKDPTFTYSATITKKPSIFKQLAVKFRGLFQDRLIDGELKAMNLYQNQREEILKDISDIEPKIHAVHIDKYAKDNPKWWAYKGNRGWVFKETLSELMDKTFSDTEDDDFIIMIDNQDDIKNGVGIKIVSDSAERNKKNVIECLEVDSKDIEKENNNKEKDKKEKYGDYIQSNDVVPREVRDREKGKKGVHILNIDTKRLTYNNVRREKIGENKQESAPNKNKKSVIIKE